jgi:hypothetical protein
VAVGGMFESWHFDRSVILLGVLWYLAYKLSLRNLEEMMAERGISADHVTIHDQICCARSKLMQRSQLTRQRLRRGVFHSVVDLQTAINRYVAETNTRPKPFTWTADPDQIIASVRRGHQALDSIH